MCIRDRYTLDKCNIQAIWENFNERLCSILDILRFDKQAGFWKGHSFTDDRSCILFENTDCKNKGFNLETCLAFTDYAFDRADKSFLWDIMQGDIMGH